MDVEIGAARDVMMVFVLQHNADADDGRWSNNTELRGLTFTLTLPAFVPMPFPAFALALGCASTVDIQSGTGPACFRLGRFGRPGDLGGGANNEDEDMDALSVEDKDDVVVDDDDLHSLESRFEDVDLRGVLPGDF